jgi:hypothetical protein
MKREGELGRLTPTGAGAGPTTGSSRTAAASSAGPGPCSASGASGRRGAPWPGSRPWRCWPRGRCAPRRRTSGRRSGPSSTGCSASLPERPGIGPSTTSTPQRDRTVQGDPLTALTLRLPEQASDSSRISPLRRPVSTAWSRIPNSRLPAAIKRATACPISSASPGSAPGASGIRSAAFARRTRRPVAFRAGSATGRRRAAGVPSTNDRSASEIGKVSEGNRRDRVGAESPKDPIGIPRVAQERPGGPPEIRPHAPRRSRRRPARPAAPGAGAPPTDRVVGHRGPPPGVPGAGSGLPGGA